MPVMIRKNSRTFDIDMKAYTYIEKGRFELIEKPRPSLQSPKDAIVRVTLGSICTSDLHIRHGRCPCHWFLGCTDK